MIRDVIALKAVSEDGGDGKVGDRTTPGQGGQEGRDGPDATIEGVFYGHAGLHRNRSAPNQTDVRQVNKHPFIVRRIKFPGVLFFKEGMLSMFH